MADLEYISGFLATVEGPRQTRGYIPCRKKSGGSANYTGGSNPENYIAMGVSGVTIATGCDLGQTDQATMLAYGLDVMIAARFGPYFGKKKDAAIRTLHQWPLEITAKQAEAVDRAVHHGYLDRYVRPFWNRHCRVKFDDLPKAAQAVAMSVCFQKGCGGVKRDWPRLWKYLTQCDWASASHELQNGFRQYASRRRTEGKLLEALC